MNPEPIGVTKDGTAVYFNARESHAASHFARQPKLRSAVERFIAMMESGPEWIRTEHDMGEIVGNSDLVETVDADEIVYARRPGRKGYTRFVKGKQSTPTSWLTIVLRKAGDGTYELRTAFPGLNAPSFPGGDYLPEQSKTFWSKHALVWGSQEIVQGSETVVCPWS